MRLDTFSHPDCGWHFHIYIGQRSLYSAFGIWYCKRCDFGLNIGRKVLFWRAL